MVVKYVEDFVGLDGQIYESKVASDCGSIRLVPDCGGLISAVFLYRDNEQNMIIPFSGRDTYTSFKHCIPPLYFQISAQSCHH